MADELSVAIRHADGRVSRWGPDEPDGHDIPNDLTFSTSIPGGFQDMSCSLLRRLDRDYPDQGLFDDVTVYGSGNRVAWQGRMQQFPRSHGTSYQITPGAVGWAAHLRDDPSFSEIFIDRDLTRWNSGDLARRQALLTAVWAVYDGGVSSDPAAPGLRTGLVGPWGVHGISELWYDAGPGNRIGYVDGTWTRSANVASGDANWSWYALLWADGFASSDTSANLRAAGPGYFSFSATTNDRRYVNFQQQYGVAAGTNGLPFDLFWTTIHVVGNHGLPIYGASPETYGFRASDVIPSILSQAAPLLTYTTGAGGSIQPTAFAIPHLAFRDPTVPEDAIAAVNAYHLYDWGVYDNREFFFRQPNPDRMLWEARLGDGAFMDADGYTGEQVINGVFVTYTDAAGTTKTVGPPNGPFDATSSLLGDASVTNPVNMAGIPRKWVPLSLSVPTNQEGAQTIGGAYLAERSLATRRGSMTLTGTITHPTEGQVPVWRVRAGDWIRVADLNGENADVPRKIISTSYSHQSRSVSLSLDNTVAKLDAILARVGIQAGVTTGGGF